MSISNPLQEAFDCLLPPEHKKCEFRVTWALDEKKRATVFCNGCGQVWERKIPVSEASTIVQERNETGHTLNDPNATGNKNDC